MSSSGMPYSRGSSSTINNNNEEEFNPNRSENPSDYSPNHTPHQQHQQYSQMQAIQHYPQQQQPHHHHPSMFFNPQMMNSQGLSSPYSPSFSQHSTSSSPVHGTNSRFPPPPTSSSSSTPSGMPGNMMNSTMSNITRQSSTGRIVSSSSSSSSSSNKAPRARVNMACIHCRSRKIRCDGNQPMCSTCTRLGRVCHYENITEEENAAVREKKRKSREARQARLEAISQLGVPMPRQSVPTGGSFVERRRPYSSHIIDSSNLYSGGGGNNSNNNTMEGSSVLRDSRLSSSPNQARQFSLNRQEMIPPPLPSPIAPGQQTSQNSFSNRVWQSQVPMYTGQEQQQQHQQHQQHQRFVPSSMTRRRGATVGGFESVESNEQQQQQQQIVPSQHQENLWRGGQTGTGSFDSNLNFYQGSTHQQQQTSSEYFHPSSRGGGGGGGSIYDVITPPTTSLSQPTTPHTTYQFHANVLSNDLAVTAPTTTTATSGGESSIGQQSPRNHDTSPFLTDSFQSFVDPSSTTNNNMVNNDDDENINIQQQQQQFSLLPSSIIPPPLATSISDDNIHAGSLFMGRTEPINNTAISSLHHEERRESNLSSSSSSSLNNNNQQQQQQQQQQQFWKRTTNSDAAIARFFAKVVAARDENNDGLDSDDPDLPICGPGGFNILAWSEKIKDNENLNSNSNSNSWENNIALTGGGITSTTPGVITPESFSTTTADLTTTRTSSSSTTTSISAKRRESELSILSQISQSSIIPGTGTTTPSDSGAGAGGFRSNRPPNLRIESLPTFAQHLINTTYNNGGRGIGEIRSNSPSSTLLTPMTLFQQQQLQQNDHPISLHNSPVDLIHSPFNLSPSTSVGRGGGSHHSHQSQIQTPITELSSNLLSLAQVQEDVIKEESQQQQNTSITDQ